jgi:hypothetical protein
MLHCHIALICYIAFVLLHCFDVLHYHITLIWYAAFNMSHCFDMALLLICCIALICYIATLLNDECGLSEMSVATWTNIIVLLRF